MTKTVSLSDGAHVSGLYSFSTVRSRRIFPTGHS